MELLEGDVLSIIKFRLFVLMWEHSFVLRNPKIVIKQITLIYVRTFLTSSAFEILSNSRVTMAHVAQAVPGLNVIDPRLLARVEIEGEALSFSASFL